MFGSRADLHGFFLYLGYGNMGESTEVWQAKRPNLFCYI